MGVVKFIISNWDNVLTVLILFVVAITSLLQWVKKKGPVFVQMSAKEKIAYVTRLLKNLIPISLVLVTDAEIQFGGGTGKIKRSYVIDELYARIPDEYKKYVTEENLDTIITMALEEAERLWEENPELRKLVKGGQ